MALNRYVILLRGINVGGHNKLPMADLRASLDNAGYQDVASYIQSGNLALSAASCDPTAISRIIETDFGLDIPVVVRTESELRAVVADNPFPELESEPKQLLVFFCTGQIDDPALAAIDRDKYPKDRIGVGPGTAPTEIYVGYGEGAGSSKLTNAVLDRAVAMTTTARNWNTVLKLVEMAGR